MASVRIHRFRLLARRAAIRISRATIQVTIQVADRVLAGDFGVHPSAEEVEETVRGGRGFCDPGAGDDDETGNARGDARARGLGESAVVDGVWVTARRGGCGEDDEGSAGDGGGSCSGTVTSAATARTRGGGPGHDRGWGVVAEDGGGVGEAGSRARADGESEGDAVSAHFGARPSSRAYDHDERGGVVGRAGGRRDGEAAGRAGASRRGSARGERCARADRRAHGEVGGASRVRRDVTM